MRVIVGPSAGHQPFRRQSDRATLNTAKPMHIRSARKSLLLLIMTAVLGGIGVTASGQTLDPQASTISVVDAPGPLRPGGVALIKVTSSRDLSEGTGINGGRAGELSV